MAEVSSLPKQRKHKQTHQPTSSHKHTQHQQASGSPSSTWCKCTLRQDVGLVIPSAHYLQHGRCEQDLLQEHLAPVVLFSA